MPKNTFTITSRFAGRINPVTGRPESHSGTDLAAPDGTPFYAVQAGTVQYIGPASGYGQWIVVDSSDADGGGCVEYGHMWNAFATGLKLGDRVEVGQLLGYVGSNGQSTGPHLHITVWERGYGGKRVDPETWLQDAAYPPPGGGRAPVTGESPAGGDVLFGVDISNHQNGFSLRRVKEEGFAFAIIKATEGTWRDPVFRSHLDDAKANGVLAAAYIYVREETSPEDHAAALEAQLPEKDVPVVLDIEDKGGYDPGLWHGIVAALRGRGYRVILTYLPRWYWTKAGKPDLSGLPPLWSSNYPSTTPGYASALYSTAGDAGWAGYGGLEVAMWQFTDRAVVAGMKVDANAFRGGMDKLRALFQGDGNTTPPGAEVGPPVFASKLTAEDYARLSFEQFAGYKYRQDGLPDFAGWDAESVIASAKKKLADTGACTPVELLFLANEDLINRIKKGKK